MFVNATVKESEKNNTAKDLFSGSDICELFSHLSDSNLSIAIALEANRLAMKYGRDVFSAEDLVQILGIGLNNVRDLMKSRNFPTLTIKGRKVVSALGLAAWFVRSYSK